MQDQWKIGADIHMAFDQLAKSDSYEDMKTAMDRTHRWLDRCVAEHRRLVSATSTGDGSGGDPAERQATWGGTVPAGPVERTHFTVILTEGRNRQIRRTFAALGYQVTKLHRLSFGKYQLDNLKPGKYVIIKV